MAKSKNHEPRPRACKTDLSPCLFLCSVLLSLAFCSVVSAEVISYESALVWRIDGSGDYILPVLEPNSTYTSAPIIETKGVIESIVATWQAAGLIRLEVSADSGLHYTQATNGLPLVGGFVQGTTLKWRVSVGPEAKVTEIKISYKDSSGVVRSFGQPGLSGFKFRKSIHISGSAGVPLLDYQLKIAIGESGHIKSDFSDIRFTLPDGETLVPYFLEKITGEVSSRTAEFFVKIPQIPPEGINLYVYYGNQQAQSLSDPEATFDFYDDFKGPELDSQKWALRLSPGGSSVITDQGLLLDAAGITSKSFQFKGGIIEYSATAETGYETRLIVRDPDPDSESDISQVAYASGFKGAEHCIAVGNIVKANSLKRIASVTRYDYRVIADGPDITFDRYEPGFVNKQASATDRDRQGPGAGYIGLKTEGPGRGRSLTKFHWIRVRKHTRIEPQAQVNLGAEEEALRLPVFKNTVLAANGNLVLAEGQSEGLYMTQDIPSPYEIRIMVPSARGAGVSFDVSADGGKNYTVGCAENIYLYASKGDFIKGGRIKGRMVFKRARSLSAPKLESMTLQYALGNIVLLGPNGGEEFFPEAQKGIPITWTAWDYERSYPMKLEYSLDGGKTFSLIVEKTENDGIYMWNIPQREDLATAQAKIRISDSYDSSINDISDNAFSITFSQDHKSFILK